MDAETLSFSYRIFQKKIPIIFPTFSNEFNIHFLNHSFCSYYEAVQWNLKPDESYEKLTNLKAKYSHLNVSFNTTNAWFKLIFKQNIEKKNV